MMCGRDWVYCECSVGVTLMYSEYSVGMALGVL